MRLVLELGTRKENEFFLNYTVPRVNLCPASNIHIFWGTNILCSSIISKFPDSVINILHACTIVPVPGSFTLCIDFYFYRHL